MKKCGYKAIISSDWNECLAPCGPFDFIAFTFPEPHYPKAASDPEQTYPLFETTGKAKHTQDVAHRMGVPLNRIIIMGDSGGDGPHFKWGAESGAFLIASMAKLSLQQYCQKEGIQPDCFFGRTYSEGEIIDHASEMDYDFMDLSALIENIVGSTFPI